MLNPLGINCLRTFPVYGKVVWGARTLRGADQLADEYKYVPIRRLALFIEESLFRGSSGWYLSQTTSHCGPKSGSTWAPLCKACFARVPSRARRREVYFVKCDAETTTQNDRNLGIVNIVVGFAPLKPAEFVMIKLQQMAGQTVI